MFFKSAGSPTWLIVFLGNPGPKYEGTRHNAGFMAGDALAKDLGLKINKAKFSALTATCEIANETVMLMKPQTFMNLSGEAVGKAARFYKIEPKNIIVISDEMTLPVGKIRVRMKGSAGGHNGLKNIIQHLGTEEFPRIRLGVGAPPNCDYDVKDWVLGSFKNQDAVDMADAANRAAKAAVCYIEEGGERCMNKFNTK